ncbi:Sulfotransfer_1 domain-containing protein [Vibrio chagasii]|nr:Sulfotransfer_1 domain-containing protein [Vibrio chagasii]CAH6943362.1 Sulfotransfer_1 domain-containing protein [Vibrio chagasii]CAH7397132.1 Sulfotransfer_1 domain-containing protein [Vibrio chagasii]CAH7417193.1 Sulfotransfer_1 domain-containing protein [Vibrio chagasii]CAH7423035.1 Sulfotransfer_1 domain-containing protein [Vibrio chagasii]
MNKKKLIVVLGVPRSGTSAITRSLQTLGAEFGDSLVEGIEGVNNKGFWEDKSILDLNERMLQALNKVWCDITPFSLSDFGKEELALYKKEAVELIQKKIQKHSFLALKEPRITKLLPFWKVVFEACNIKPTYIIALRKPCDVFNSFKRLENVMVRPADICPTNVDLIWLSYLSNTLQLLIEKENTVLVSYDSIVENPINAIKKLSLQLGLDIDADELNEYAEGFIDKKLNHSVNNDNEAFYLTKKLYDSYFFISESGFIPDSEMEKIAIIKKECEKMAPLFNLVDSYREKLILESDLVRTEEAEHRRLIDEKNKVLEDLTKELENRECLRISREKEIELLKSKSDSLQVQINQVSQDNHNLITSYSMRITKPLRILNSLLKKAFRNAR